MKRRLIFISAIIISVLLLLLIYARFVEPSLLFLKKESLQTKKIYNQVKIIFFTDTHFSKDYSQKNAERIVKKVNNLKPDVVIFGGDFIDNYTTDKSLLDLEYIKKEFSKINAPYGKFAVYGNHEYGGGFSGEYNRFMNSAGFKVLKDSKVYINNFNINIIGVDDFLLGNLYTGAGSLVQPDSYNILITHSPDYVDNADISGIDLMLAGHTHGKQILFNKHKYPKGFYKIKNAQLFVSAGIGLSGPPFRFMNPPEIVLLEIKKK